MDDFDQSPDDTAPPASHFPPYPLSWYFFGLARELPHGRPIGRDVLGRKLVAYRRADGRPVLLEARCCHLGADLSLGSVRGDALQCPFHHWEYGPNGRCQLIPVTRSIPEWARQASYPVVERNGHLYFFNAPEPLFPLPFFPDCRPEDFVAAPPFSVILDCPWYMIGANAFDLQHFRAAHDRRLVGEPEVSCPAPFARRAGATFQVASDSFQDRVTRLLAGPEVYMASTDWCGNLVFTIARFRRSCSYGMIVTEPLGPNRVHVHVIVFVPRSASALGRLLIDPLHASIRRLMIRRFLSADAALLVGTRYNPHGLIAADRALVEYFQWLARVAQGRPAPEPRNGALPPCPPPAAGEGWGGGASPTPLEGVERP